jgi:tRNA modification GTPase
MTPPEETIAAIGTPIGQGGIGIVRVSGSEALPIAKKIFRPKGSLRPLQTHRLYLGHLLDPLSGEVIDEILLSYMKAPHSYTGEDVVEINSHSGYILLSKTLQIVMDQGARLARPGEFTLRAFLNGRIDLTQAEGIVDLITSKSENGLRLATQQIKGALKEQIENLRRVVFDILTDVEFGIDFPEEETAPRWKDSIADCLDEDVLRPIDAMITAHTYRRLWVDGVNTVIVGRTNVGKSSLFNQLVNEKRAIVTPIPGTTRDIIETVVSVHGLPLNLMDTAGLREVTDEVEQIGVQLTTENIERADLLLVVLDQSEPLDRDDLEIISRARGKNALIVVNKNDQPDRLLWEHTGETFGHLPVVTISALTGQGIDTLRERIKSLVLSGQTEMTPSLLAPNLRQQNALRNAARYFRRAARLSSEDQPAEIIALELRAGLDSLGEIVGDTTTEDIIDNIFTRFCIGK